MLRTLLPRWMRRLARVLLRQIDLRAAVPCLGRVYLVLPAPAAGQSSGQLSACTRTLLARARQLAEATWGPIQFLTVDARSGDCFSFPDREKQSPRSLFAGRAPTLLANLSFLLRLQPTVSALRQEAAAGKLAVLVSADGQTLEAVVTTQRHANQPGLAQALAQIVSPLQRAGPGARSSPFGPVFLNQAMAELLHAPADGGQIDSPQRLRQALLAQRERSAVPWLFNALVNEVESRLGLAVLDSYPPEVHLSLTGRCNIECRFCSYAHRDAYSDFVTPGQVARLDFLRHAHTLRLSSGLGEPTINPHLPEIVHFLARTFPHLVLNFFTNGITLGRPGLIEALVGRVAWINVSLNAASRATWQELCQRDAFDQLTAGLKALQQAKAAAGQTQPVVHGSMVLTRQNLHELPRLPALCRRLGVDRFTAIPFLSYTYDRMTDRARYGPDDSFHLCRDRYDELHQQTVEQARQQGVSVELPLPAEQKRSAFGLEARSLHNFADLPEPPYYWLPGLLSGLPDDTGAAPPCLEVYRKIHIGTRTRTRHPEPSPTHHVYPCLGPMSRVDFAAQDLFDLPDAAGVLRLWNDPLLVRLRAAQGKRGLCRVCDACRSMDSRDPHNFAALDGLLAEELPVGQTLIPTAQLKLRSAG